MRRTGSAATASTRRGRAGTERCLEMTARYAKQRKTFGAPLSGRQAVQFAFADLYTRHQAGKMLTYRTACNIDAGKAARHETYMTKIFCTELAFEAADRCMQFHGAMGLSTEMPIERLGRWARRFMINGGGARAVVSQR